MGEVIPFRGPSGLTEDERIDREGDVGVEFADGLLDAALANGEGLDHVGIVYSAWVALTHMLAMVGWTAAELNRDVDWHVAKENESEAGS